MSATMPSTAIRTQVMWNRLIAVVEEQAQTLIRTAFGTITREAGDLSAGVYDTSGRMLAQAVTGTPGHVNSMADGGRPFPAQVSARHHEAGRRLHHQRPLARHRPSHDYAVVTPAFLGGKLVGAVRLDLPRHRYRRPRHVGRRATPCSRKAPSSRI